MYYKSKNKNWDEEVIEVLNYLAEKYPRNGFKKLYLRIRNSGYEWNHKKVYRVYKKLGLNIRRKMKKRLPARIQTPLNELEYPNQVWAMDFMSDTLWHGKRYRLLNIIDEFNRELLHVKVDTSLPARRVIEALEQVCEYKGYPSTIRVDNGPEFISTHLELWCNKHHITLDFIRPGKPTENARVERFNGSMRRELLDCHIFTSLSEVREKIEEWMLDYNYHRPHEALGNLSPIEFLKRHNKNQILSA
jgi:putative transposase